MQDQADPSRITVPEMLSRMTIEQLDRLLDAALAQDELILLWQIVAEIERRGDMLVL